MNSDQAERKKTSDPSFIKFLCDMFNTNRMKRSLSYM
jgi:hypothetical protein